jgi:hypothetical protein
VSAQGRKQRQQICAPRQDYCRPALLPQCGEAAVETHKLCRQTDHPHRRALAQLRSKCVLDAGQQQRVLTEQPHGRVARRAGLPWKDRLETVQHRQSPQQRLNGKQSDQCDEVIDRSVISTDVCRTPRKSGVATCKLTSVCKCLCTCYPTY